MKMKGVETRRHGPVCGRQGKTARVRAYGRYGYTQIRMLRITSQMLCCVESAGSEWSERLLDGSANTHWRMEVKLKVNRKGATSDFSSFSEITGADCASAEVFTPDTGMESGAAENTSECVFSFGRMGNAPRRLFKTPESSNAEENTMR